ncbi:MAG: hypothetical protein HQL78_07805 [Magnetococcales bacterium]|nr:hypothetical protein [Magnetococcales bacterium]
MNNEILEQSPDFVSTNERSCRLHFEVSILYSSPLQPKEKRTVNVSDILFGEDELENLCESMESELPSDYGNVSFVRLEKGAMEGGQIALYFALSKCRKFKENDIYFPKKNSSKFKIIPETLSVTPLPDTFLSDHFLSAWNGAIFPYQAFGKLLGRVAR